MSNEAPREKKSRVLSLDDPTFSDLTLKFGDHVRRVHKNVLCSRSGWFAAALTSTFQESKSAEIVLREDDPAILQAMLDWCYHGNLDTVVKDKPDVTIFRIQLFQLADKYDIPMLKKAIENGFKHVKTSPPSFPMCTDEPDDYERDLIKALKLVYEMPHAATMDLRRDFLTGLDNELRRYIRTGWFQDLLDEEPSIARDILRLMGDGNIGSALARYQCGSCGAWLHTTLDRTDAEGNPEFNDLFRMGCPFCDGEHNIMMSDDEGGPSIYL